MNKLLLILIGLLYYSSGIGQIFYFDFLNGQEGWSEGFADYPAGQEDFYELDFQWLPLPIPLDTNQNSLYISGNNHSDDLFMFIKKEISGLQPYTSYIIDFDVEFASKYPTNAVGVGGAPGESVNMKAGASLIEPDTIHEFNYVRMNIDKDNQSMSGSGMDTIGHVGVTDTTTIYALKSNNNYTHPFPITTDSTGNVWLIIGTDSGFEATTSLFYNKITATFSVTTDIKEKEHENIISFFPNPTSGTICLRKSVDIKTIEIFGLDGHLVQKISNPSRIINLELLSGVYVLKAYATNENIISIKKLVIDK